MVEIKESCGLSYKYLLMSSKNEIKNDSVIFPGALAYAELGTMNTSSGAEYAYFMDAFGPLPAFLFSWVSTLVLKPSQMAIISLSFAQYTVEAFVGDCEPPTLSMKLVAVLVIREYFQYYIPPLYQEVSREKKNCVYLRSSNASRSLLDWINIDFLGLDGWVKK